MSVQGLQQTLLDVLNGLTRGEWFCEHFEYIFLKRLCLNTAHRHYLSRQLLSLGFIPILLHAPFLLTFHNRGSTPNSIDETPTVGEHYQTLLHVTLPRQNLWSSMYVYGTVNDLPFYYLHAWLFYGKFLEPFLIVQRAVRSLAGDQLRAQHPPGQAQVQHALHSGGPVGQRDPTWVGERERRLERGQEGLLEKGIEYWVNHQVQQR